MGLDRNSVDGRDIAPKSVDTEQVTSKSLPTWRVYNDGSETVAVDETSSEIARDPDPAVVWQAAFDAANSEFDNTPKYEEAARIDGGQLLYTLGSSITAKKGARVTNARFDASNLSATSFAVTFGGPDNGFLHGAVSADNITVLDAADAGVRFRDMAWSAFDNIYVEGATGDGVTIQSCVGCRFNVHSRNSGGVGIVQGAGGDTAGPTTASLFYQSRSQLSGGNGWNVVSGEVKDCVFVECVSEDNGSRGVNEFGSGNLWLNPWLESNGTRGMTTNATKVTIVSPNLTENNGGGGGTQGIRIDGGSRCVVRGPVTGNDLVNVASGNDHRLVGIPSDDVLGTNATRVRWNGLGQTDGSPTASNWDPGDLVRDTTNSTTYLILQDNTSVTI